MSITPMQTIGTLLTLIISPFIFVRVRQLYKKKFKYNKKRIISIAIRLIALLVLSQILFSLNGSILKLTGAITLLVVPIELASHSIYYISNDINKELKLKTKRKD